MVRIDACQLVNVSKKEGKKKKILLCPPKRSVPFSMQARRNNRAEFHKLDACSVWADPSQRANALTRPESWVDSIMTIIIDDDEAHADADADAGAAADIGEQK